MDCHCQEKQFYPTLCLPLTSNTTQSSRGSPYSKDQTQSNQTRHTRKMVEIEEIEDSDPEEMDIDDFDDGPIRPAIPKPAPQSIINPANIPMQSRGQAPAPQMTAQQNKEASKNWQCVYPVYFDKTRTRDEGRRVAKELAVENPLAREMAEAIARMGLNVVFEPTKTHPKDWSNPGRCRVLVKENGKAVNSRVSNSKCLICKMIML